MNSYETGSNNNAVCICRSRRLYGLVSWRTGWFSVCTSYVRGHRLCHRTYGSICTEKISSEVGFKGICKKVAIFCLVGIGHVLDTQVIQNGSVLRTAVIFFYLSNEGISIIENVALIGLPVPKKLKEVLEQLHEEADEKKEDE